MSPKLARLLVAASIAALTTAFVMIPPKPTVLVVRVGMPYDEVIKRSSYPALAHGMLPSGKTGFGTIDVTKPAVIIKYDDPQNGFELPPTKFAAITFGDSMVEIISTSPMLEARRFPEAVEVLAHMQETFRSAGWVPWTGSNSKWYNFSPQGREALHGELLRYDMTVTDLVVPKRGLTIVFGMQCLDDCDDKDSARYIVKVGISKE